MIFESVAGIVIEKGVCVIVQSEVDRKGLFKFLD